MKNYFLLFTSIFCIAFFLRAYHLADLFPFTMDEEYQAFLVQQITHKHHFPLIGVNVADTGLYLGSFFTWLSVIPYWLSNGNPIGTAWTAALIGALTAGMIAWITYKMTDSRFSGYLSGLLYAINPLITIYDRKYWNPSLVPLLTVVWLISIWKIKKDRHWLISLVLVFGLAFHIHYSLFILLPVTLFWIWKLRGNHKSLSHIGANPTQIYGSEKRKYSIPMVVISIVSVCLTPLLLFELRHDFLQTRALIRLVAEMGLIESLPNQPLFEKFQLLYQSLDRLLWVGWNRDITKELSACVLYRPSHPGLPINLGLLSMGAWLWFQKKHRDFLKWYGFVLASFGLGMIIFPVEINEYYFLPLFSLTIILISLFFSEIIRDFHLIQLRKNSLLSLAGEIVMIGILIIWTTQTGTLQNHLGLAAKMELLKTAQGTLKDNPYHLEVVGTCYQYEGYRYLTEALKFPPVSSYMDSYFGWLYTQQAPEKPKYQLVIRDRQDSANSESMLEWKEYKRQMVSSGKKGSLEYLVTQVRE